MRIVEEIILQDIHVSTAIGFNQELVGNLAGNISDGASNNCRGICFSTDM
jgi:hypothetical protein